MPDNVIHFLSENPDPHRRRRDIFSFSQGKSLIGRTFFHDGRSYLEPVTEEDKSRLKAEVDEARETWSYILMGMLAKSGPTHLALSSGSTPGIFVLTKNDGSTGEIEFDSETGYPSVIRYNTQRYNGEMRFIDRFSVDGIMFSRVTAITTGDAYRDTVRRIEEVQINPDLRIEDFPAYLVETIEVNGMTITQ